MLQTEYCENLSVSELEVPHSMDVSERKCFAICIDLAFHFLRKGLGLESQMKVRCTMPMPVFCIFKGC